MAVGPSALWGAFLTQEETFLAHSPEVSLLPCGSEDTLGHRAPSQKQLCPRGLAWRAAVAAHAFHRGRPSAPGQGAITAAGEGLRATVFPSGQTSSGAVVGGRTWPGAHVRPPHGRAFPLAASRPPAGYLILEQRVRSTLGPETGVVRTGGPEAPFRGATSSHRREAGPWAPRRPPPHTVAHTPRTDSCAPRAQGTVRLL